MDSSSIMVSFQRTAGLASQHSEQDQFCVHITSAVQGRLVHLCCKGAGIFSEAGSAVSRAASEGRFDVRW